MSNQSFGLSRQIAKIANADQQASDGPFVHLDESALPSQGTVMKAIEQSFPGAEWDSNYAKRLKDTMYWQSDSVDGPGSEVCLWPMHFGPTFTKASRSKIATPSRNPRCSKRRNMQRW
jgi:hypothetical protein